MKPEEKLLTRTFVLAFLANFFLSLSFSNNAMYPLYVRELGGGAHEIGLFMGVYFLAAVAGRPLIGYLIDRWGIKLTWITGCVLMIIPPLGFTFLLDQGFSPLVWTLRLMQGFGFGMHFTAFFTMAGAIAPAGRRNEAIAKYGMSGMFGHMIGPYLGERLVEDFGLPVFFLATVLFGVLTLLSVVFLRSAGRPDDTSKLPSPSDAITVLRSPGMLLAFFFALSLAVCYASPASFLAPIAKMRGISHFGLYFTAFAVAGVTFRLLGSHLGDVYGVRRVMIPGFISYGVGLMLLGFSQSLPLVILAGLFAGLGHGIVFPAVTTLGYNLAPPAMQGSGVALVTGMMDGGNALAALLLGWVAGLEPFGFDAVFPLAVIAPALAVIVGLIFIHRQPEIIRGRS